MCLFLGLLTRKSRHSDENEKNQMWRYQHPDDFYDSNRDRFDDFEDAEDYYYKHGGQ